MDIHLHICDQEGLRNPLISHSEVQISVKIKEGEIVRLQFLLLLCHFSQKEVHLKYSDHGDLSNIKGFA